VAAVQPAYTVAFYKSQQNSALRGMSAFYKSQQNSALRGMAVPSPIIHSRASLVKLHVGNVAHPFVARVCTPENEIADGVW